MSFTTDNRWSPGSSGAQIPDGVPAAYAARWIDKGDYSPADVVPDRQGFAYNDPFDRKTLKDLLIGEGEDLRIPNGMPRDTLVHRICGNAVWHVALRRSGGYIYCDAWLAAS